MNSITKPILTEILHPVNGNDKVKDVSDSYLKYFTSNTNEKQLEQERIDNSNAISNAYYDLATDFYEYGYGEAFHFACMKRGESREHAFAKQEYRIGVKLNLKPGETALDVGCGIGGPARHIAAMFEARVIGLNCNQYQLQRARILTHQSNLTTQCSYVMGDFCASPFDACTFDKAYAIEATCHAPDLRDVYREIYRVLKPGGLFVSYEWITTDKFDSSNAYHKMIRDEILVGNGLPLLHSIEDVHSSARDVGFEVVEAQDYALKSEVPWYSVLQPQWTVTDFKITPLGRWMTHIFLYAMETFRMVPRGAVQVHRTLCRGADNLILGGIEGIFSPMYLVVLRKPLN